MKEMWVLKETMAKSKVEIENKIKSKEEEWRAKECKYVEGLKEV